MMSDLEANIVAVERVKEYSKTETEVGTGMSLGQGDSGIAGEGCLVTHHLYISRPALHLGGSSFIHSFIHSWPIEHQPDVPASMESPELSKTGSILKQILMSLAK